jgi:hypothetical protein
VDLNQKVSQLKTQFEMKEIIERCFEELERSGAIKPHTFRKDGSTQENPLKTVKTFESASDLADHISKTLIGELLELDIIRRQAAVYREIGRLERDFVFIEAKSRDESEIPNLRIDKA